MGLRIKMGVYDKNTLSCNGHSDRTISELIKIPYMEMLFILYKSLIRLLSSKAVRNHEK